MNTDPQDVFINTCKNDRGIVTCKNQRGIVKYWRPPLDQNRRPVPHGITHILEERCKGCGFCVEFCPRGVLVMSERTNAKGYHPPEIIESTICADCGLCALLCPDFAIYVESSDSSPKENNK